jgi:hypothetical protein
MPWASIVTWLRGEWADAGVARCADPSPWPPTEPDARRVLEDVRDDGVEVCRALDHPRLEAPLKEVAAARVAPVEPHRVDAVQSLHSGGELGLCRLDEQVEVVVEQVPGVHLPAEAPLDVEEESEPGLAVEIVEHDRSLLHAAADDVVPRRAR